MGSITGTVIIREDVECQNLMGAWTGMSPQQLVIVASFSAMYPSVLVDPRVGRDNSKDFSTMKTFEEWNKGNSQHGLFVTLVKSMRDEKKALMGHINSCMASHPLDVDLCLKILTVSMGWWEAFIPMLMGF